MVSNVTSKEGPGFDGSWSLCTVSVECASPHRVPVKWRWCKVSLMSQQGFLLPTYCYYCLCWSPLWQPQPLPVLVCYYLSYLWLHFLSCASCTVCFTPQWYMSAGFTSVAAAGGFRFLSHLTCSLNQFKGNYWSWIIADVFLKFTYSLQINNLHANTNINTLT